MKRKHVGIFVLVVLAIGFAVWNKFIRTVNNLENKDLTVQNPYEAVARATGGQVMHFDKSKSGPEQVQQMTELALQALKEKDYALLWRAEGVSGYTATEFSFDVDSSISELSVFVSGVKTRPEFNLIGPNNHDVAANSVLKSEQSSTALFQNPSAGTWRLRILKSDNISVYVRAKTNIDVITVGTVERGGRPGHEGWFPKVGPLKPGGKENIVAEISGASGTIAEGRLEAVSVDGRSLAKVNVNGTGSSSLIGEIKIPSESFRIMVSWKTADGKSFRRMDEKTFELNKLELVNFKHTRHEPQDSFVCKVASQFGIYQDKTSTASVMLMCVNRDGVLSSELSFSLPLQSDEKIKKFRFISPDYQTLTMQDCELAAKAFASFPKIVDRSDGKKVEFMYSCQPDAGGLKGVVGVKATQP